MQVEGATCSGKSSIASGLHLILKRRGVKADLIEEAATKVFGENQVLIERLVVNRARGLDSEWKRCKTKLQEMVLSQQLAGLELFAQNNSHNVGIMDRGGASTAFHTLPFVPDPEREMVEKACREISRMATRTILLSTLGFLQQGPFRYQETLKELADEAVGIRQYLDTWGIDYVAIRSRDRVARARKVVQITDDLLERYHVTHS